MLRLIIFIISTFIFFIAPSHATIWGESVGFDDLHDQRTFSSKPSYDPEFSQGGLSGNFPGSFTISWDIEYHFDTMLWHYEYSLSVKKLDISHFILELSDSSESNDILNTTINGRPLSVAGLKEWTMAGNQALPNPINGLRFRKGENSVTYSFDSTLDPVWGNFYIRAEGDDDHDNDDSDDRDHKKNSKNDRDRKHGRHRDHDRDDDHDDDKDYRDHKKKWNSGKGRDHGRNRDHKRDRDHDDDDREHKKDKGRDRNNIKVWNDYKVWNYYNDDDDDDDDKKSHRKKHKDRESDVWMFAYNNAIEIDGFDSDDKIDFIVRPDGGGNPPVVPEPLSYILFIIGGVTLGLKRFLKKRTWGKTGT